MTQPLNTNPRQRKLWHALIILMILVFFSLSVEQLGYFFITEDAYHWFDLLKKPSWTPSSFLFPILSTGFYLLAAFAAWIVCYRGRSRYRRALIIWGLQLILNALWTTLFFAQEQIIYSLTVSYFVWLFSLLTTALFFKQSKLAGVFMVPNTLWITLISVLNFMIWQMNL